MLLIARLDRLARSAHFITGLIEARAPFVAVDMPHASKTMLQIYAAMAEWERDAISRRTKEALAAAKARGVKLGLTGFRNLRPVIERRQAGADAFAESVRPLLEGFIAGGISQRKIAKELNSLGVRSPRGTGWRQLTVQRVMKRLAAS